MDASTFRWVLVVIALLVAVGIYGYGQHQARLRRRSAVDSLTRDEIDSAFVEDEELRNELDNLNQIMRENEVEERFDDIVVNPIEEEVQTTPFALPDPELYEHPAIAGRDPATLVSYHLRHDDFRPLIGAEIEAAVQQALLEPGDDGFLEYRENAGIVVRISSLSAPGDFASVAELDFKTIGCNCFIDLDRCEDPRAAYELLLRKVDELVRILNVKVYKPDQQLLTISDVTETRKSFDEPAG